MERSFKIREASITDVPSLAALHVATFNETHGSLGAPAIETRQWQWQKAFQEKDNYWFCLLVENESGNLVGFAKGERYNHADHAEFSGELNKIYLLREYHRLGIGRKLICKVATEFIARGITSMLLFGDAKSPSNKFYESMGAQKLIAKNGEFHGGYGWADLRGLSAQCAADDSE